MIAWRTESKDPRLIDDPAYHGGSIRRLRDYMHEHPREAEAFRRASRPLYARASTFTIAACGAGTSITSTTSKLTTERPMMVAGDMPEAQRPLHALNRLGFGPGPGTSRRCGNGRGWLCRAPARSRVDSGTPARSERIDALPTLRMTPVEVCSWNSKQPIKKPRKAIRTRKRQARREARQVMTEAVQARIIRALYGARQLQQVMTDFWFNHFNIFAGKGLTAWTGAYERDVIRPHALGSFRDLLVATAQASGDAGLSGQLADHRAGRGRQARQIRGINENYGREVMELHTLGVNGGYTPGRCHRARAQIHRMGVDKRAAPAHR